MKIQIKQAFSNSIQVFSNYKYVLLSVVVALLFYILNVLIFNPINFFYGFQKGIWFGFLFIINLVSGFHTAVALETSITMVIISILFGILFSLILFKTRFAKSVSSEKSGTLASIGIFLGVLAPGCAACGVGIVSLLGLGSAFISFFPYDGIEISVLSIILLVGAVYHFALQLTSCKIK